MRPDFRLTTGIANRLQRPHILHTSWPTNFKE